MLTGRGYLQSTCTADSLPGRVGPLLFVMLEARLLRLLLAALLGGAMGFLPLSCGRCSMHLCLHSLAALLWSIVWRLG